MIKLLTGLQSSASALQAERLRMEVISQNIANAETTKTPEGGPYQRQVVSFETLLQDKVGAGSEAVPQSVQVARITRDQKPGQSVFRPGHPDADGGGMVQYPNVNMHEEWADYIASSRSYEANLSVIKNARTIALQTLSIGRR
jgi:flagellar basal-body rod protein FlgC